MKTISPELYCLIGIAIFIGGLFLLLISLNSNGDVWLLDLHFYKRNLSVVATVIAMIGGAATTYGLLLLRKPPNSN